MWIKSNHILSEQGFIKGFLHVEDGLIKNIETDDLSIVADLDFSDDIIIPGLIDIHLHGYRGLINPMTGFDLDEFELFLNELAYQGTTACLPSVEPEYYPIITQYQQQANQSMFLGLNLEAYFSCETYQTFRHLIGQTLPLNTQTIDHLMQTSNQLLKYVMIAPELEGSVEAILRLKDYGVCVSVGHTTMSANQFKEFFQHTSFDALTHTGNNMGAFHQRDVGVLGVGLLDDHLIAEMITDMLHLSKDMIEIILKLKKPDRCILVSDSVFLSGLPPQTYPIQKGKYHLYVTENLEIRDFNGDIQGCYHTLFENMITLVKSGLATLEEAVMMASLNPAKFLNKQDKIGSIACSKYANLLVLDQHYQLKHTLVCGEIIKRKMRE